MGIGIEMEMSLKVIQKCHPNITLNNAPSSQFNTMYNGDVLQIDGPPNSIVSSMKSTTTMII